VFFRNIVALVVLSPWLLRRGLSGLHTQHFGGHLWRSCVGLAAMYCFFFAIGHMPLANAMLLNYAAPLYIPFAAWLMIGEKPPRIAVPVSLVGLLGVALIVKPGSVQFTSLVTMLSIASGVMASLAMVGIRRLAKTEPPERIVFMFAAISTVISLPPAIWAWAPLTLHEWALLIGTGATATAGQLAMTRAYASAPAARVGPFQYFNVIFGGLVGWLLWSETPDFWSVVGTVVVIGSCVMVSWKRPEKRTAVAS